MAIMVVQAGLGGDALARWVPGALLILLFSLLVWTACMVLHLGNRRSASTATQMKAIRFSSS